jgi:hypothetical protein
MSPRTRGSARAISVGVAALIAVSPAAADPGLDSKAAPARISCYFDYGSGIFQIKVPETVSKQGPQPGVALIAPANGVVTISDGDGRPVECSGSVATLDATRTIVVVARRAGDPVALGLDLRQAPLTAGPTPEGDPGADIAIDARIGPGEVGIALGDLSDQVIGGTIGGVDALDLDAQASAGVDLLVDPQATLRLDSGGGANAITLDGGAGFDGPWTGPSVLAGGASNDLLIGGDATDLVFGGNGADQLYGRGGNDLLSAGGTGPDLLDCGANRDVALASGPGDTVRSCELKRRRLEAQRPHAVLPRWVVN